ncbi:MAG: adenylate kinase, partial [Synergistaceae bacterium]|nr:adenylate kinase [Synergistaceae bacterium]
LGAPGAGKGTQAVFLKERHNLAHISTGDIFRENLKNSTPLGLEAKKYMDAGQLVPDEIVMKMVGEKLAEFAPDEGFMLDGFPRTVAQAEFLESKTKIDGVIMFAVPDEAIVKRLTSRAVCKSCGNVTNIHEHDKCPACGGELYRRDDDNEDTIRSRLKVFHEQTEALVEFYRTRGLLIEIDATGMPEEVFARVVETLEHD